MKYPKNMEDELNELDHFEFVNYSRIDGNPIYKLISTNKEHYIPFGGERLPEMEGYLKK